jgi:hypothetical protein
LLITSVLYPSVEASGFGNIPSGIAAAVDTQLVMKVKNYLMPMILEYINNERLPRMDFDGGYVENVKLDLYVKSNNSLQLNFSEAINGGILTASDIGGSVTADVKYRALFIPVKAKAIVTFDDNAITLYSELPFTDQVINNRTLPRVDVKSFDINFDTKKIHINLEGSLLADIIAVIVRAFKTSILKAISKVIDQEVPTLVQESIND